MNKTKRPKNPALRAGNRPGERVHNAPPGGGRPIKPKGRGPIFTRARGRAEDEGVGPSEPEQRERPDGTERPRREGPKPVAAPRPTRPKSRFDPNDRPPRSEGPRPSQGDRPAKAERAERPNRAESASRADRPAKTQTVPQAEKVERTERPPRAEKVERFERPPREAGEGRAKPKAKAPFKPVVIRTGSGTETVKVRLVRGKSKPFWIGHPWIFSGAIQSVEGELGPFGAPCIVEDERDNPLGFGHYNPDGQIAVRLLWHRRTTDLPFAPPTLDQLIDERIKSALSLRQTLGLPNEQTNVYRLINAEGDFLPGLIVDRLGDVTSIQLGSRQMYEQRDALVAKLASLLKTSRTVISVTETASKLEGLPSMVELEPPLDETKKEKALVEIKENGLRYRVDLEHLQKTGFYVDQRENRQRFAAFCKGKTVLDAYCHVGGFGLAAARAGAARVVQVDSSNIAIDGARAAADLNGFGHLTEGLVTDAIVYLKESQAAGRLFDRIIIDPPKFAQGRSHLEDAIQKYARLNTLAMAALAPGGLMLTCSCSRHVSEEDFGRMLTEAGHRLRKSVRVLEKWGQPTDHPTLSVAPEGRYLKCWLVSVSD